MSETEEETVVSEVEEIINAMEKDSKTGKLIKELDKRLDGISLKDILIANKKMITETKQAKKEKEEYLATLQRFKADFENYKKRAQKQADNSVRYSSERILDKILAPIENIDRAIKFAKDNEVETIPLDGIEVIYERLMRILEEEEVGIINPNEGDKFDPNYHEAVCVDATGKYEPELVVQLIEKGYKIKEKVLHTAKVMVSIEKEEIIEEEEKQSN